MVTDFACIAAVARDGAIGKAGGLPWPRLRWDMHWFSVLTRTDKPADVAREICANGSGRIARTESMYPVVIAGHTTFERLPSLRGRIVLRLSRQHSAWPCAVATLHEAIVASHLAQAPHVMVIGGAQVYATALAHPACQRLYLTEVASVYPEADTHFPAMILWDDGILTTGTRQWRRIDVSGWVQEQGTVPRYRFGIWEPVI